MLVSGGDSAGDGFGEGERCVFCVGDDNEDRMNRFRVYKSKICILVPLFLVFLSKDPKTKTTKLIFFIKLPRKRK